jgi:hypothetical protein
MLSAGLQSTPYAALSRPVCGIRGNTIIITLPGSTKAALENLSAILPILPHALELVRGSASSRATHEAMHAAPSINIATVGSPIAPSPSMAGTLGSTRLAPYGGTPTGSPLPHQAAGSTSRSTSPIPTVMHATRSAGIPGKCHNRTQTDV